MVTVGTVISENCNNEKGVTCVSLYIKVLYGYKNILYRGFKDRDTRASPPIKYSADERSQLCEKNR